MLQRRTEIATIRKLMGNKRCRDITMWSGHKIETYVGKKTTNKIVTKKSKSQHESSYKQQSGRNLKTHVATQKMEE